ncbi:MAG: hypothetical protein QOF21_893 [Actinomycetota bacterium]|jgi:hypothetical protein
MSERDELLDRLAAARPVIDSDLLEPNHNLLEEILMTDVKKRRRIVTPVRLSAIAAVAATLVGVALVLPTDSKPGITVRTPPNMQRIAESTSAALSSGRAHLSYTSDNGHFIHDSGAFTIEFSGENRSSVGTIDPGEERSDAFEVANKVVDGRFYLRDGAPGQQHWIEDTNEHITGSDIFSVDPRSLVTGAAQDAAFEDVGTATVDGVATHHLKATRLDKVPTVNLGLGPIADDQTKITKFDVWVDSDNVVRRLDVATSRTETIYPLARTQISTDANGNVHKSLDQSNLGPSEERTTVSDYSVVFTDIGAPIEIVAPANATKVAGQG